MYSEKLRICGGITVEKIRGNKKGAPAGAP